MSMRMARLSVYSDMAMKQIFQHEVTLYLGMYFQADELYSEGRTHIALVHIISPIHNISICNQ